MVVIVRPTSLPSDGSISSIIPSPSPLVALFSFSESIGVSAPQKRQDGQCSTTILTTAWLPPKFSSCTVSETVLPCGNDPTGTTCPGETKVTITVSASSSPTVIPPSMVNHQQNEGPPSAANGDISQGRLSGIIVGTVLGVVVLVVLIWFRSNRNLLLADLEPGPRRPTGNGGDAGGGAPPEAPAPAEPEPAPPPAPAPAPAPAPEPAPPPDPAAPADPPPAPPAAANDLALLPPEALNHAAAHAPPTPHSSPTSEPSSSEDEYVYRRRIMRRRRSSSESRVRFADEPEIIPDRRRWRDA